MGAYNNDGDACVRPRVMMCEYECEMGVRREGERERECVRERERSRLVMVRVWVQFFF